MRSKNLSTIYGKDLMDKMPRFKLSKVNNLCTHANRTKFVKYTLTFCVMVFLLNMFILNGKLT